jgi:hypothetical protein
LSKTHFFSNFWSSNISAFHANIVAHDFIRVKQ